VAFVLLDVFGMSFEEIAGITGRSPVAAGRGITAPTLCAV
jgi:hypothetical protein